MTGDVLDYTSIEVWQPTGNPNELLYLGERDADAFTAGSYSRLWDGFATYFEQGTNVPLPVDVVSAGNGEPDFYVVKMNRDVWKWRQGGAGQFYTRAGITGDVFLFYQLDYQARTSTFSHAEDSSGAAVGNFPYPEVTVFEFGDFWHYEERVKVYQYTLNTSTGVMTETLNGVEFEWHNSGVSFYAKPGTYELRIYAENSLGADESAGATVTIP